MDLGAYAQIEDLRRVADENSIDVRRLRGYRLMSQEKPITKQEIEKTILAIAVATAKMEVIRDHEYSKRTERLVKKYLTRGEDSIRWDRVHGKRRKAIKFIFKQTARQVKTQYEAFNRYAGRNDVLYIHARIGRPNWIPYGGREIERQSWFLEKVDDANDYTYCDIYAKIKPVEGDQNG